MRRLILVLVAALLISAGPAAAASSLEARIQTATGIVRTVDASLQAHAATRVTQIQTPTTFNHCCLSYGETEIIGRASGYADPLGALVSGWVNSPEHAAILFDPGWHTIGCAVAVSGTRTYGVCLFAAASKPVRAPAPKPINLPNTAMEAR